MRLWDPARWRPSLVGGALAIVILGFPSGALAQGSLALADALRESLKLNPNILLQQQQVIANQGAELQAQGQFDPLVNATVTRNRDVRPLREDEKQSSGGGGGLAGLFAGFGFGGGSAGLSYQPNAQISNTIGYAVNIQQLTATGAVVGVGMDVTTLSDNLSN